MTKRGSDKQYLMQYMRYLRPHKTRLAFSLVSIPLIAGIHVSQPLILKYAIDNVFLAKQYHLLCGLHLIGGCSGD